MRRKWLVPLLLLALLTLCFLWGVTGYPHPAQLPSGGSLEAPSAAHWLGTDNLGVDIYAQISAGFFRSLGIGLAAGIMARLGFMKSFPKALITACVAGFVAVLISTPLNVIFWGGTTGNVWGDMVFAATQAAGLSTLLGSFLDEIVVDVPDKIITLIVVYFVLKGLPRKLTALYDANAKIEHLE